MECISNLILFFAAMPRDSSVSLLTSLLFIMMILQRMRPCTFCAAALYFLLVLTVVSEDSESSCFIGKGLFEALPISPTDFELNLLMRLKFNASTDKGLMPSASLGNYMCAFLRYLVEPNNIKIYRK